MHMKMHHPLEVELPRKTEETRLRKKLRTMGERRKRGEETRKNYKRRVKRRLEREDHIQERPEKMLSGIPLSKNKVDNG